MYQPTITDHYLNYPWITGRCQIPGGRCPLAIDSRSLG